MKRRVRDNRILRICLPLAFWLGVWQLLAMAIGKELLLPTPVAVAKRLLELAVTAAFWRTVGLSLARIFSGAVIGTALGVAMACLCRRLWLFDVLFTPVIRIIRATPVASFIILVLLWVVTGRVPMVISALTVLPVVWENTMAGLAAVDPQLRELAGVYGMGAWRRLRFVTWPAVRPGLLAGISTAIGLAWKSGVAAEVLCTPRLAIGTQIYYAKLYLETPSLFAWTAMVAVLSLGLEKLLVHGMKRGQKG